MRETLHPLIYNFIICKITLIGQYTFQELDERAFTIQCPNSEETNEVNDYFYCLLTVISYWYHPLFQDIFGRESIFYREECGGGRGALSSPRAPWNPPPPFPLGHLQTHISARSPLLGAAVVHVWKNVPMEIVGNGLDIVDEELSSVELSVDLSVPPFLVIKPEHVILSIRSEPLA